MIKKWKRNMKAQDDKQQTVLSPESTIGAKERPRTTSKVEMVHTGTYSCPFCLHQDKMEKFLISTKKGFHKSLGECPDCKNRCRLTSLTAKMTPEQFAEWCYQYSGSGYWSKVKFKKFSDRLYKLGWAKRFWDEYHKLKKEDDSESYDAHLTRKEKEAYEEYMEGQE